MGRCWHCQWEVVFVDVMSVDTIRSVCNSIARKSSHTHNPERAHLSRSPSFSLSRKNVMASKRPHEEPRLRKAYPSFSDSTSSHIPSPPHRRLFGSRKHRGGRNSWLDADKAVFHPIHHRTGRSLRLLPFRVMLTAHATPSIS